MMRTGLRQQARGPAKFSALGASILFCAASGALAEENPSDPLATVNNTDFRFNTKAIGDSDLRDFSVEGSYMARPDIKLKYELHYSATDISGSHQNDFESVSAKAIYFPSQTEFNDTWGVKTAVGLEWIVDLGEAAKGIGSGSDLLAPFLGLSFSNSESGLTVVPLIQHYEAYKGEDLSQTSIRLIAIQPFAEAYWAKFDLKLPYDWGTEIWSPSAELQLGYNIKPGLAAYTDFLVGIGENRSFDRGIGLGLRFTN